MEFYCSQCNKSEEYIDQNVFVRQGQLEEHMMEEYEKEYDELEITDGDIVYYYFELKDEDIIRGSQDVAGRARSFCKDCIDESIENTFKIRDPHYCDGVYLTRNKYLNTRNLEVRSCHGIQVSNREFRVKLRINKSEEFLRILKTGGVIKTNEGCNNYEEGTFLFLNKNRNNKLVTYLGIEEYKDSKWRIRKGGR